MKFKSFLAAACLAAAGPLWAQSITMASTTSTEQSGLFSHLLPAFKAATGLDVKVIAVGTGQAIDMARRGDADVLFVHDQMAEEKFVADGFAAKRYPVMYNDFVLVGPKADPTGARGVDIAVALGKVAAAGAPFISRGDKSGTHAAELRYWNQAGLADRKGAGYRECGCGMGPALNIAASAGGYALTDRGTWLNFKNRADLAILVEGDRRLFNQYGVMAVSTAKHPHVKAAEAQKFVDWVVSPAGQASIAAYKIGGEQLFFSERCEVNVRWPALVVVIVAALAIHTTQAQTAVSVYAAGSLRAPLTEAARAFESTRNGVKVELVFGASGLLRDRIQGGEAAQLFASANMEHPRSLSAAGGWGPTRAFARNALCALAPQKLGLAPQTLVATLLDPKIRVGTSTPKADPSGDYAFEMFARIGRLPGAPEGAQAALEAKALQLTGGPSSPPPPAGRNVYGALVAGGQADVFITYCTNAAIAVAEQPSLQLVDVPDAVNVTADYGLAVQQGTPAVVQAFADYLVSEPGQAVLRKYGFRQPE